MINSSTTVHEGNCDTLCFQVPQSTIQLLGKINKIRIQLIATEEKMAATTFQAVTCGNIAC